VAAGTQKYVVKKGKKRAGGFQIREAQHPCWTRSIPLLMGAPRSRADGVMGLQLRPHRRRTEIGKVGDYFTGESGRRWVPADLKKAQRGMEVPCHHNLEKFSMSTIAGLPQFRTERQPGPLFRRWPGRTGKLGTNDSLWQ